MNLGIWLTLVLGIIILAAIFRSRAWLWSAALGASIALGYSEWVFSPTAAVGLFIFWALLTSIVLIPRWRQILVTKMMFRWFSGITPTMSQTEQEALDAGSVWWDRELFSGRPNWNYMLSLPTPSLSKVEQEFIDGPVTQVCRILDEWEIMQKQHDLPPEIWDFLKRERFFAMIIPKEYGGLEFSAFAHSEIVMKIASRSVAAAVSVMVPNSLGPAKLLLHYGTDEQRNQYLPRLATGEEVPCFALTGPEAGSDAAGMPDTGVVCRQTYNGVDTLGVRLNWEKRYITLGPIATVLGLAFKLFDPEHLIGDEEARGITLALIPTNTPGIEIGRRHNPLNTPFQNGPNKGVDVFIPLDWIIGGVDKVGHGWRMLMECLAVGRAISLPALSTGAAKSVSRYTGAYARVRRQFRLPIGRFEGVEEVLGRIAGHTYQMDAARCMTLGALDSGESPSVISAIVKYHLTEGYRQVTNDAMDIQGGSGICLGPRNLVGAAYMAIPIAITVEGANILTRSMIIFGQGAIRCHPYVLDELRATAMEDHTAALRQFDTALTSHIGFFISNAVRSLVLGITRGRFSSAPLRSADKRYYQRLNWMCAAFALTADAVMLSLGGSLKRREKISARLGDVLSHLYLASATLKRFHDQGYQASDRGLFRWSMAHSMNEIEKALDGVFLNLGSRPLAWLLRRLVFPLGARFSAPHDRYGQRAAQVLLKPSAARDRLTKGIFITDDLQFKEGLLDIALAAVVAAEPVEHKLRAAVHAGLLPAIEGAGVMDTAVAEDIISAEEAELLRSANEYRRAVIEVDSYEPDEAFGGDSKSSSQSFSDPVEITG